MVHCLLINFGLEPAVPVRRSLNEGGSMVDRVERWNRLKRCSVIPASEARPESGVTGI